MTSGSDPGESSLRIAHGGGGSHPSAKGAMPVYRDLVDTQKCVEHPATPSAVQGDIHEDRNASVKKERSESQRWT
jgi:hypothetical protein